MKELGRGAVLAIALLVSVSRSAAADEPPQGSTPPGGQGGQASPPTEQEPPAGSSPKGRAPSAPSEAVPGAGASVPVTPEEPPSPGADQHAPQIPAAIMKMGELAAKFDDLNVKGWNFQFPSVGDTILRDEGGFRSALAEHNIGISIWNLPTVTGDALHSTTGPQLYNGQKVTGAGIAHLFLTYNVPSAHLQVVAAGSYSYNTWNEGFGPSTLRIFNLSVYQELFGGKLTWEAGWIGCEECRYYGFYTGGNVAGGLFGNNGNIPYQVGMSFTPYATPTLNVKANLPEDFYVRGTAQRAFPAGGATAEDHDNVYGLRPVAADSDDVTFIGEIGKQRKPSPNHRSHWYRVTGWFDTAGRNDFRAPLTAPRMTPDDWALTAGLDQQIYQDATLPFDGIYVGASAMFAPPDSNLFSQYYELRAYSVGLIPHRELDFCSVIGSYTVFSAPGRRFLESIPANALAPNFGVPTYAQSTSIAASYAAHLFPGFYASAGLALAVHPAVAPRLDDALIYHFGVTQFY